VIVDLALDGTDCAAIGMIGSYERPSPASQQTQSRPAQAKRPALTYIMKGSLTEHRKGGPDRTYKAGEVLTETTDVDHWAENTTAEPVILISADLFKE
jgi:hypothetical protein